MKLGNLIAALEQRPKDETVRFDFCGRYPTKLQSYRGYYDQLALGHAGHYDSDNPPDPPTVASLLAELRSAIGKTFTGWKGGDFRMDKSTTVWIDNPGECNGTAIVSVVGNGYATLITTRNEDE